MISSDNHLHASNQSIATMETTSAENVNSFFTWTTVHSTIYDGQNSCAQQSNMFSQPGASTSTVTSGSVIVSEDSSHDSAHEIFQILNIDNIEGLNENKDEEHAVIYLYPTDVPTYTITVSNSPAGENVSRRISLFLY